MPGISWIAVQLAASEEGFVSMKIVSVDFVKTNRLMLYSKINIVYCVNRDPYRKYSDDKAGVAYSNRCDIKS
jgi:hypothetical protein